MVESVGAASSVPPAVRGVKRGRFTVTRLHRSGRDPHRVLLLGSRSQLAPNRLPQAEALGERIADRLWLRTGRGVDLDMLWELRPVLRAMQEGLSSWRFWRYDAVVVVSLARPAGILTRWRERTVNRLLDGVIREVGTASHVLVVSLQEPGEAGEARAVAARRYESPVDEDGTPRVSSMVAPFDPRTGADAVVEHLLGPLAAADSGGEADDMDAAHRRRLLADDEGDRQRAVDRLELRERQAGHRLQQVVDLAKQAFETASAEVTIIDQDQQWTLAASGRERGPLPRRDSLCSRSIEQPTATVIGDTWTEPSLRGNPQVTGPSGIRFYAAHPIESVDGYRIGVLCVWDTVPHEAGDFDAAALRDLALLAEGEIIGDGE